MIFVDTSAWYAVEVEDDVNHEAASKFLSTIAQGKHGISITTDYVLNETLTLLRSRRSLSSASAFIDKIKKSKSIRVFWVEEACLKKHSIYSNALSAKHGVSQTAQALL